MNVNDDGTFPMIVNPTTGNVGPTAETAAFLAGGAGGVTPGPFLEPTTATPEEVVNWLIDNGFMEAS